MLSLTPAEQALLDGAAGPGVQRAMEIVVTLGRIYGAPDLTPITHVQISGVSYKNLGDAGVQFLNAWAEQGATVRVPTTLNPAGMELDRWEAMGISPDFAGPQLTAISAFVRMGVNPTMSCTPYLFPDFAPRRGDHLAWAESSAVAWANSVVGAYTNREGGPSALAAAIVGRTARYGYHLHENRQATHVVEVDLPSPRRGRLRRAQLYRGQSRGRWRALTFPTWAPGSPRCPRTSPWAGTRATA